MTNERWLTACHEAGHAVACLMRGGGSFTSVTIEPTAEYLGRTSTRIKEWDDQFVSYAGPWAEARAQWPSDLPIDELDDDGDPFEGLILAALIRNPPDFQAYREPTGENALAVRRSLEQAYAEELPEWDAARDRVWDQELEEMWPVMLSVAQLLMDNRPVTAEVVRALIETCR